jgi:hypothetical protein
MEAPVTGSEVWCTEQGQGRTNESPGIASLVDFHARSHNVRGVAEIRKPHVLNVEVIEGLLEVW